MTTDITVYAIRCDGELVTTERASIAKAWKEGGIEVIELSTTARHLQELRAYELTVANRDARIAELEALLKFADERINKLVDEQAAKAAPQQKGEWSREVVQGYLVIRSPLGDSYEFPLSMLADHFAQEAPLAGQQEVQPIATELAEMLERSVTGLGHYRDTKNWSEADEEHINECNALLERFACSENATQPAAQAVPVEVPTSTSADDANARYGEAYGVDWVYTAPAHPAEGVPAQAAQPSDALIEAVDAWFAENTGLGGCSDKDVAELAAIFATHPTQQGLADLRWQIVHDHIGGEYIAGRACFVVQMPALPGANIMRGSVAEHFTKAVDAIAAQAKQGGV